MCAFGGLVEDNVPVKQYVFSVLVWVDSCETNRSIRQENGNAGGRCNLCLDVYGKYRSPRHRARDHYHMLVEASIPCAA